QIHFPPRIDPAAVIRIDRKGLALEFCVVRQQGYTPPSHAAVACPDKAAVGLTISLKWVVGIHTSPSSIAKATGTPAPLVSRELGTVFKCAVILSAAISITTIYGVPPARNVLVVYEGFTGISDKNKTRHV